MFDTYLSILLSLSLNLSLNFSVRVNVSKTFKKGAYHTHCVVDTVYITLNVLWAWCVSLLMCCGHRVYHS